MKVQNSFIEWFDRHHAELEAVVMDVDGILVLNRKRLRGSLEMVRRLRALNMPVSLLTNAGNISKQQRIRHFRKAGFDFVEDELTSCAEGLYELSTRLHLRGKTVFVVGELGTPDYATLAGMKVTRSVRRLPECAAVVVGENDYDWDEVINGLVNFFIRHPARPLIVPNPDGYFPDRNKTIRIGAGGTARFVAMIAAEYGLTIKPIYLGKPYAPIFHHNHLAMERRYGRTICRSRVIMLGDLISGDIAGAHNYGYRSALFLTGVTTLDQARRSPVKPEFIFKGF